MNSEMAKAILAKIYEKQAQNPYGEEANTGPRGFNTEGYPTTKYTDGYSGGSNPLAPPNPWAPTTIPGSPGSEIEERSYLSRLASGTQKNLASAMNTVGDFFSKKQTPSEDAPRFRGIAGGRGANDPTAASYAFHPDNLRALQNNLNNVGNEIQRNYIGKGVDNTRDAINSVGSFLYNAPGRIGGNIRDTANYVGNLGAETVKSVGRDIDRGNKATGKAVGGVIQNLSDAGSAISQGLSDYQNEKGIGQRLADMVSPTSWYDSISRNYKQMTTPQSGNEANAQKLKEMRQKEELNAGQKGTMNKALLMSLGLGAGAGGLYALHRALRSRPKRRRADDMATDVYYPVERNKAAADSYFDYVFGGHKNPSVWDDPLFIPKMTAGGLGLAYGGYKGTQYLVDKLIEKSRNDEMRKAENDFNDALLSNYDQPTKFDPIKKVKKKASEETTMTKLSSVLDQLYNAVFEKKANGLSWSTGGLTSDLLHGIVPVGLTLGGLGALATGTMAYDAVRGNSKAEALKDALRERARQHYEESMPPLYITPESIDISKKKKPNTANEGKQNSGMV